MATMPIEVIEIGDVSRDDIGHAISMANSIQDEFSYLRMPDQLASYLRLHAYRQIKAPEFLDTMEAFKSEIRGYHPYVIAIVDADVEGTKLSNLFGSHRASKGLAIVTEANVPGIIVPNDRMVSYYLYYFGRYTLSFISPRHKNHEDSRGCVFDRKTDKLDILKSMRARSLCDDCRQTLLSDEESMSPQQFEAIESIFDQAGKVLRDGISIPSRPTAFIGSSVEGLQVANQIQLMLEHDLSSVIWNQGTVFGLGESTLEALENAVSEFDFGIFIFTPDDLLHTRGELKPVARDNVIFELGLFIGKLTRHRAFVVHPRNNVISLPSDLAGITMATYDASTGNLAAALGPPCHQIRMSIRAIRVPNE